MKAPHGLGAGALLICLSLMACDSGEQTLREADGGALPAGLNYYEAVEQIVERNCAACHHSGGGDAPGGLRLAEDDRDYSTCEGIQRGLGDLIDSAVDGESMPPGAWPRLTEEEKLIILEWVNSGACSPCTPCP